MAPTSLPVSDEDIQDLRRRLAATRQPRLPRVSGWERGTNQEVLSRLLDRWQNRYDWRAHESRILAMPWETVGVGDTEIHYIHIRASDAKAPAVVLLHGWPDSVLRFERVLPLLASCHVVVPALPGFPFASELSAAGMNVAAMASLIADTMQLLGYQRYVASGGDVGADVAEQLAAAHPDRVQALHLTNISPLHAVFADRSTLDAESLSYLERVAVWQRKEGGYIAEQSTKPHTLAAGLADSPAGLASWLVEKLQSWSDAPFDEENLLTWISAYWFSGTIGTSFGPYIEFVPPVSYVETPTILSVFAHDTKPAPFSFASKYVNVRQYIEHESGGHFAAWEQPERYVSDLRLALTLAS